MHRRIMLKGSAAFAGLCALVVETGVEAQAVYPARPIRMIVPFTPSGSARRRQISQTLSE